jgi:anti-sigma B factor antagonist
MATHNEFPPPAVGVRDATAGPGEEIPVDPDGLRLSVLRLGRTVVVLVAGEVELVNARRLTDTLTAELSTGPSALVVDLDEVRFFTSMGLTALAMAQREAGSRGITMRVVATGDATRLPLELTGLLEELAVYRTRDEALEGLPLDPA